MIHYSRDCLFRIIVLLAAGFMLLFCALAVCYGDYTAATPPGQWGPIPPPAAASPCDPNDPNCPTCPQRQQPSWQPQQPQWQQPAPQIVQRPMAPVAPQQGQPAAVCRVRNQGRGSGDMGSGTLVDRAEGKGLVVTARHVFADGLGDVTCEFAGRSYKAQVVSDKDRNDLAALLIDDPGVEPIDVAPEGPRVGQPASSAGFGRDGRYLANYGRVLNVRSNLFEISGAARSGDSGGPVLDSQGRLIGVLWGTDKRTVVATSSVVADRFLFRAGRYLLPWNARINDPARDPRNQPPPVQQPPQVIVQPPMQQMPPPVDLSGVQGKLAQHDAEIAELGRRADASKAALLEAAAKFEKDLPGIKAFAEQKAAESAALAKGADEAAGKATKRVDEALDDENPRGILGRVKARLEERFGGALGEVSWMKWGGIGLAIAVVVLFVRKDIKDRRETGDPLLIEKLVDRAKGVAARTETDRDDRLWERVESRLERIADRIAAKPPAPPPAA